MSHDLVAIAERALDDRFEAEQLVAGLCRLQAGLVTTATRSAMPNQRDAARVELERLVRRAALDTLPPVIAKPSPGDGRPTSATAVPASRKLAAPASGKAAGRAAAPAPAAPPPPIAAAPPRPSEPEPAPGASHRRPAGRPGGLADLASPVDLPGATRPRGPIAAPRGSATAIKTKPPRHGRTLALTAVAVTVLLGGLGFGYLAYAPEDPIGPDLARLPASSPQPAPPVAPPAESEPARTAELPPESLQLEAVEPSAAPLRERIARAEPTSPAPPPPQAVATLEPDLRLVLLYQSNSTAAARADELRITLAALKDPPAIALRSVGFIIAAPRIRYFYAADAAAAAALAEALGPPGNGTATWEIQDFTHFRPGPSAGTLEVYIPTTAG